MTGRSLAALAATAALLAGCAAQADRPAPPRPSQAASASPTASGPAYRVVRVADGDTLTVSRDGREVTVRLIGVDTPETVDRRKPVQCYGPEASAYTRRLKGQRVRLERGDQAKEKYGRELAFVWVGGRHVNLDLIQRGYARAEDYGHRHRYQRQFEAAEREARAKRVGRWGRCP